MYGKQLIKNRNNRNNCRLCLFNFEMRFFCGCPCDM